MRYSERGIKFWSSALSAYKDYFRFAQKHNSRLFYFCDENSCIGNMASLCWNSPRFSNQWKPCGPASFPYFFQPRPPVAGLPSIQEPWPLHPAGQSLPRRSWFGANKPLSPGTHSLTSRSSRFRHTTTTVSTATQAHWLSLVSCREIKV